MTEIPIESDLLLVTIEKEDRLKVTAKKILERIDSGEIRDVYASVAVLQEVIFWFYKRQLRSELAKAAH